MKVKRIVFLNSGGGGNLMFIHRVSKIHDGMIIVGVFADRACGAIEFANKKSIPTFIHKFDKSKEDDDIILENIISLQPDIVVTNIHKILSSYFLSRCNFRLINLHYSLLPSYSGTIGMLPLRFAIERKNSVLGCTVHEVTDQVDRGDTICQGVFFKVSKYEDNIQLMFRCGAIALLSAILSDGASERYRHVQDCYISPNNIYFDLNYQEIFVTLKQ